MLHNGTQSAFESRTLFIDREAGANMTGVGAMKAAVERRGRASSEERRSKDEEGGMMGKHL